MVYSDIHLLNNLIKLIVNDENLIDFGGLIHLILMKIFFNILDHLTLKAALWNGRKNQINNLTNLTSVVAF